MNENEELDLVTMSTDDGQEITLEILDYFFYQGEEYAVLTDYVENEEDAEEDTGIYILKVNPIEGTEDEELVPIEDEVLEDKLFEIATTKLREDDDIDSAD